MATEQRSDKIIETLKQPGRIHGQGPSNSLTSLGQRNIPFSSLGPADSPHFQTSVIPKARFTNGTWNSSDSSPDFSPAVDPSLVQHCHFWKWPRLKLKDNLNYWIRRTHETLFQVAISQRNKQMHRPEELHICRADLALSALQTPLNHLALQSVRFTRKWETAKWSRGFRRCRRRATTAATRRRGSPKLCEFKRHPPNHLPPMIFMVSDVPLQSDNLKCPNSGFITCRAPNGSQRPSY
jgi:hypothetical protein